MAKDLKAGDTFTLEFRVTKNWGDGLVSATNPHLPNPIHLNEGEISDATVTRGKPKEPERKVTYEIGVVDTDAKGRRFSLPIAKADTREEAEALKENLDAVWIHEVPVPKPRKKR